MKHTCKSLIVTVVAVAIIAVAAAITVSAVSSRNVGLEIGDIAPDFTLNLRGGGTVKLSDLRGKPVLLNFCTTWCPPCQTEFPEIQRVADKYGDRIHVLGVSSGEAVSTVNEYFDDYPDLIYMMAFDPDNRASSIYDIEFIPQTWVLDSEGVVVDYIAGSNDLDRFSQGVDIALVSSAEPSPSGNSGYSYEPLPPEKRLDVDIGAIKKITDDASAIKAIKKMLSSLTPEQRQSGDALDTAALFIENAARAGASENVSGDVELSASLLSELAGRVNGIMASADSALAQEGVGLLRKLRPNVTVRTEETDELVIAFPDNVSGIAFSSVTVEAEFASVTLSKDSIVKGSGVEVRRGSGGGIGIGSKSGGVSGIGVSSGSGGSGSGVSGGGSGGGSVLDGAGVLDFWAAGVVALVLIIWGVLAALGHKFRAWVVPTFCALALAANAYTFFMVRDSGSASGATIGNKGKQVALSGVSNVSKGKGGSGSIEVTLTKGVSATVSLPAAGGDDDGDSDYYMLINEDGVPQYGKYNPVTGMIDSNINESGVYTLNEYVVSFDDIEQKNDMMREAISMLASRGIISGTKDGHFYPDNPITRAELVAAVVRAFDMLDESAESAFGDVSKNDWYYSAVATAVREHIVNGFDDNTFRGGLDIPKEQLVAITANTLIQRMGYIVPDDIEAHLARYLDRANIAAWSEGRVALATQSNILIYRLDSMFAPKSVMTRGDAAIVLYRVFNKVW